MNSYFTPEFFINNRNRLRDAIGTDTPIVVTGNGSMQRGGDEPFKFHQDSNFWYLTGLSVPDLVLVVDGNSSYIIAPSLSVEREAFDGGRDEALYQRTSGIAEYLDEKAGWQRLRARLQTTRQVATLGSSPEHLKRHGLYTTPYRRRLIEKMKRYAPRLKVQDIRTELANFRCIKQPQELLALQQAIDITTQTLQEMADPSSLAAARYEYEIEAAISYGFRSRGSSGHAFSPIVGAGAHGTTLHHVDNNGSIKPGDLIVVDIGADVEHYCADITRTISQRHITGRMAQVFCAVEAVQDFALSHIKPGTTFPDYEKRVHDYMGEQLIKLGLVTDPTHESIRHYFPHATSHFLGLDTHDVGDYRAPWQENMVITCEPGIYIPEEGIGVRIEDDVLITADGCKVLSAACPRRLTPVQ